MAKAKVPARAAKQPLIDSDPRACVAKLSNRIAEIEAINGFTDPDDARFEIAQGNIAGDVLDIFGDDSIEFSKYEHHQIWRGGFSLHALPDHELRGRECPSRPVTASPCAA